MRPMDKGVLSHTMRDPQRELAGLRRRFSRVSQQIDRARPSPRPPNRLFAATVATAFVAGLGWASATYEFSTLVMPVRHFLATRNCDLARLMQLAPSRRGEWGYAENRDKDGDGIACEPWRSR